MEKIIHQIASELAKNILNIVFVEEIHNLEELSSRFLAECRISAAQMTEVVIEQWNLAVRNDKAGRKARGLVLKEKDRERTVLTELEQIHFKRDYYWNSQTGSYSTPLDAYLGVDPYERIGKAIKANLVSQATEKSFNRSAEEVTGGKVSRQTVRNSILKAPELEYIKDIDKKSEVKELHLFVDEGHAHLQKPGHEKGKRSQMIPLVTVSEGMDLSSERHETINKYHIVDSMLKPANVWEKTDAYVRSIYPEAERIYIHADGGNWIQNGLDGFKEKVHVMDGYHMEKMMKSIDRAFPNRNLKSRLYNAIEADEKEKAARILEGLRELPNLEAKQYEKINETETYLFHHWEALRNRRVKNVPGSCTEAQVSHVLSERFSRNPMGWSRKMLGKLSLLRVYIQNGGRIEKEHFAKGSYEPDTYIERIAREDVGGCFDWSIFEHEQYIYDTSSATQILLSKLGQDTGILS